MVPLEFRKVLHVPDIVIKVISLLTTCKLVNTTPWHIIGTNIGPIKGDCKALSELLIKELHPTYMCRSQ